MNAGWEYEGERGEDMRGVVGVGREDVDGCTVCEDSEIVDKEREVVGVWGCGGIDVVGERTSRENWPSRMDCFRACG